MLEIRTPEGELVTPNTLGQAGLTFWNQVTQAGHWLWPGIDETLLIMAAEAIDERAELRAHVMENPEDWKARAGLRLLEKQLLTYLTALGFTPSDRAKLGLIRVKAESKLEELLRRVDEL